MVDAVVDVADELECLLSLLLLLLLLLLLWLIGVSFRGEVGSLSVGGFAFAGDDLFDDGEDFSFG